MRKDGRKFNELRPVKITTGFVKYAEGSVLIECGDTASRPTCAPATAGSRRSIPCCPGPIGSAAAGTSIS